MKLVRSTRLVFALFAFLFSCSSSHYQSPRYVKLADEITMKTAKKLQEQKNLCLVGTGGQMMHDIKLMRMGFYFYSELGLEAARKLLIDTVNEYLLEINNSKEIRPYLHESPFTAKNVEINIWIYNPDGSELSPEKIYSISAIDGIFYYYTRGPGGISRQAICEETYEEALKLANNESVL